MLKLLSSTAEEEVLLSCSRVYLLNLEGKGLEELSMVITKTGILFLLLQE
jgi:hypothetical protein